MIFLSEDAVEQALLEELRALHYTIKMEDNIGSDLQDSAIQTVLQQAEALSARWSC